MLRKTLKMEEVVIDKGSAFVGHAYVQNAGAGWEGGMHHTYKISEGVYLEILIALAYGDSLRLLPKKTRWPLTDLHNDDEDPSDASKERAVSGDGDLSERGSKESLIADRDLGTAVAEILED